MTRSEIANEARKTAMGLRDLATRPDAMHAIGCHAAFAIGDRYFHSDYFEMGEDRGVNGMIPASPITPLELIDDACALEAIATKLSDI